jgi:hypothetical protein
MCKPHARHDKGTFPLYCASVGRYRGRRPQCPAARFSGDHAARCDHTGGGIHSLRSGFAGAALPTVSRCRVACCFWSLQR